MAKMKQVFHITLEVDQDVEGDWEAFEVVEEIEINESFKVVSINEEEDTGR